MKVAFIGFLIVLHIRDISAGLVKSYYSQNTEKYLLVDKSVDFDHEIGSPFTSLNKLCLKSTRLLSQEQDTSIDATRLFGRDLVLLDDYKVYASNGVISARFDNKKEYFGMDKYLKSINRETSVYVPLDWMHILPGEKKTISFSLNEIQNEGPLPLLGIASRTASTPGENSHREWLLDSSGVIKVLGIADQRFDEDGDIIWGGWGFESLEFGFASSKEEEYHEVIDVTVNLQDGNGYLVFQRYHQFDKYKVQASKVVIVSLVDFARMNGDYESLSYNSVSRKATVTISGTKVPFDIAKFGPELPSSPLLEGKLVKVFPEDACSYSSLKKTYSSHASTLKGKIAFVYRGNCDFVDKVYNLQKLGAIGVIVANFYQDDTNEKMGETIVMIGGDNKNTNKVNIPSVFVSYSTAVFVEKKLDKGSVIKARLSGQVYSQKYNGHSIYDSGLIPIMWLPPKTNISVEQNSDVPVITPLEHKILMSKSLQEKERTKLEKYLTTRTVEIDHMSKEYLQNCLPMKYLPLSTKELKSFLEEMPRSESKRLFKSIFYCNDVNDIIQYNEFPSMVQGEDERIVDHLTALAKISLSQEVESLVLPTHKMLFVPWSSERYSLYNIFNTKKTSKIRSIVEKTIHSQRSLFNKAFKKMKSQFFTQRHEKLIQVGKDNLCSLSSTLTGQAIDATLKKEAVLCSFRISLGTELYNHRGWEIDFSALEDSNTSFTFGIEVYDIKREAGSKPISLIIDHKNDFLKLQNQRQTYRIVNKFNKMFVLLDLKTSTLRLHLSHTNIQVEELVVHFDISSIFKTRDVELTRNLMYSEGLGFNEKGNWFPTNLRKNFLYKARYFSQKSELIPYLELNNFKEDGRIEIVTYENDLPLYNYITLLSKSFDSCVTTRKNLQVCKKKI